MKRLNVFADEAGNFDFSKKDGASSYFIVCTITMEDCANPAASLIELRRQLAWEQAKLGDYFHCTNDVQAVRNRVMRAIIRHDFHIQATVMEKAKANPSVRKKDADFYRHGWLYHLRHGLKEFMFDNDEVHITAASLGTKKDKVEFTDGVREVVRGEIEDVDARTSFWPCATDPCLQIADYCTWAIQRKWEKGDMRTYDLVKDRITYEYDLFKRGSMRYY